MKKFYTTLLTAILLASLTGCSSDGESSDIPNSSGDSQSITDSSGNSGNSDNSGNSESAPEPQKPAGEPTFLTAPDGTPIYTSEITSYQSSLRESDPGLKNFPLDTFNKETFTDEIEIPYIVCDGFAYAFLPRIQVNITEAPDKFKEDGGINIYSGEEVPPSGEYFKLKVGDKFGGLTVESARAAFSNDTARYYDGNPDEIPGIYLTNAEIKYKGEIDMTGYITVMETIGYDTSGDLYFCPDGSCVSNIPVAQYKFHSDLEPKGIYHEAYDRSRSYGEFDEIKLGNMNDYNIDFDGLRPGDDMIRVKITIKDLRIVASYGGMACYAEPVTVEVLR